MANKVTPSNNLILEILSFAERNGLSIGGLALLAMGMYGGQYAKLFPEHMQDYAAWFCLLVSGCGLIAVVYQLFRGFRAQDQSASASPGTPTNRDAG
jgi:hypothetical protein